MERAKGLGWIANSLRDRYSSFMCAAYMTWSSHEAHFQFKISKYSRDSRSSPLSGIRLRFDLEAPRIVTRRQVLIRVTSVAVDDAGG